MRNPVARFKAFSILLFAGLLLFSAVGYGEDLTGWKLPPVPIPADNPQSDAKTFLGHQLIFDIRLSKGDSISCENCHLFQFGGGGPTPRAFGHGGELGRWAPSWINSGYYTSLFWDGRASSLEEQTGALPGHIGPITNPGEMAADINEVAKKLNGVPGYKSQFNKVFGTDATPENIAKAIAAYQRTLVAYGSPFQRYVRGDKSALTPAARRGFELFQGKAECATCHTPPLLTDNGFHDIGVPQVGPLKEDLGRFDVTKDASDKGKFKTPSLYNSATFAYLTHDGAFSSIEDIIEHYDKGGNPNDPNQDPLIMSLHLSAAEKSDLLEFIKSLTDKSLNEISTPKHPR